CASFDLKTSARDKTTGGTAKTSPYQYVSTVMYAKCVVDKNCGGHCSAHNEPCAQDSDCPAHNAEPLQTCVDSTWGSVCTNPSCYGVPLTRQLITKTTEDPNRTIPMMGMDIGQRSMLTVNNGTYYINTTVSLATQKKGVVLPPEKPIPYFNVFQPDGSYYLFFVYATEHTKQKYQIYIGKGIKDFKENRAKYVKPVRVDIQTRDLKFPENAITWTGLKPDYIEGTGILTLDLDFTEFKANFVETRQDYCQPKDFCEFKSGKCQSSLLQADPLFAESQLICEGAGPLTNGIVRTKITGKDVDCPLFQFNVNDKRKLPGCIGVKITLGNSSQFQADDENQQPRACCFPNDPPDL